MSFLKRRTNKEFYHLLRGLSRECSRLGGPLTKQLYHLVRDKRLIEVAEFVFDYTWVFTVEDFLYARQIQALVSKQDFLDLGVSKQQRQANAMKTWFESEESCRKMNHVFDDPLLCEHYFDAEVGSILYIAQQKIAEILTNVDGDCIPPSMCDMKFQFGPGSVTSTEEQLTSSRVKLNCRLDCSPDLLPIVRELLEELPYLSHHNTADRFNSDIHDSFSKEPEVTSVEINVTNSELGMVPKTYKVERVIETQQLLNALYQRPLGVAMRRCLLRNCKLDLREQAPNQKLALLGSLYGKLCTMDLVSASGCISRGLVWHMFPYYWAEALDFGRSSSVTVSIGGKKTDHCLQQFSGMGNAYTFELETVLFYALTWATCKFLKVSTKQIRVFGDDIIVPVESYDLLDRVLTQCGFFVNSKKSFKDGPFRESCGADYLRGMDIRPFYVTSAFNEQLLYSMHNFFIRNLEFSLAKVVLKFVRHDEVLWGPDGYGDGHLIGDHALRRNRAMERRGFEGGVFDTYVMLGRKYFRKLRSDYIFPFYSVYVSKDDQDDPDALSWVDVISADPFTERGVVGYEKISIYTLARSMFKPDYLERTGRTSWGDIIVPALNCKDLTVTPKLGWC